MKTTSPLLAIILLCASFSLSGLASAANPIVTNIYTADPTIRFFEGRYWLYTTHDEVSKLSLIDFDMRDWRAYSSTDLEHWTDHGVIMSLDDVAWASKDAWAVDVVYHKGLYYMYFPVERKYIGVATSTSPAGPFTDAIGKPLLAYDMPNAPLMTIDPAVLIDDDGQVYLYFGNDDPVAHLSEGGDPRLARKTPRVVRLKANMLELAGPILDVPGIDNFFEAPFIHKRDGIYYLSYAANGIYSDISYATADNPMGPFTKRGVINDRMLNPKSLTNHHSILDHDGKSYFFYHTTELSDGNSYRRSVAADNLYYNADGSIQKVRRTPFGVGRTLLTNAGETSIGATIAEADGRTWYWDRGFSTPSKTYVTQDPILGTTKDMLYQVQRYGEKAAGTPAELKYTFPVPSGRYEVRLHFAETYFTRNGMRQFHIDLEGRRVLSALDIHTQAGHDRALIKTFATQVSDGELNVNLVPVRNKPQIAAIEIRQIH